MLSVVLQVELPTSLETVHWYSPTSIVSHFCTSRVRVPVTWDIVYFPLLFISFVFLNQVISNGAVPATPHSKQAMDPFTTSAGESSRTNVGGSETRDTRFIQHLFELKRCLLRYKPSDQTDL